MELSKQLNQTNLERINKNIYANTYDLITLKNRYSKLVTEHNRLFNIPAEKLFSTSGRTELGGNHTDHNLGIVVAGTINLDTIAAVHRTNNNIVIINSEGYPSVTVDISDTSIQANEQGTTNALVRGIASIFKANNVKVSGFSANTSSNVLKGSGLSSSAAIEVLIATIFNNLFNNDAFSPLFLAQIGQESENKYFGKPCGLMDQVACANGGIVTIDFEDKNNPKVKPIDFSFNDYGYNLIIVDTGGNHADLTDDYASIPSEMKSVANFFGKKVLREVDEQEFYNSIPEIRKKLNNDRMVLRAIHFFNENKRCIKMKEALEKKDFKDYLANVKLSGHSSFDYLQNLYSPKNPKEQGLSLAIALTENFCNEKEAFRVQGGGFAGTIQAYIENPRAKEYIKQMEKVFSVGCCIPISIRAEKSACLLSV
ncbi:MAG: galactokinase family protein [Sphaerochaetaceae bacterium]|nr:galactokinase family protein [Sphaerochaetaceae bacterium]